MVTHIANAGVLIVYKDIKLLIDGIHKVHTPPFESVKDDMLNKIIRGDDPIGQIDIALFTHDHQDHFDLASTKKFVEMNNKVLVVGPKSLCTQLRQVLLGDKDRSRIITSDLAGVPIDYGDGISIKSISIPHEGKKYLDVENIGFLIDLYGIKVLHLGDAALTEMANSRFRVLTDQVDVALLNFPFVTLGRGRQIISEVIRPGKVYVLHLPNQWEDKYDWIGQTKRAVKEYASVLPEIELFNR